jgi:hypothetical protein
MKFKIWRCKLRQDTPRSMGKGPSDPHMLAKVEKWMAIIRERPDRHCVD